MVRSSVIVWSASGSGPHLIVSDGVTRSTSGSRATGGWADDLHQRISSRIASAASSARSPARLQSR